MKLGPLALSALALSPVALGQGQLVHNPHGGCCHNFGWSVAVHQGLVATAEAPFGNASVDVSLIDATTGVIQGTWGLGGYDYSNVLLTDDRMYVGLLSNSFRGEVCFREHSTGAWTCWGSPNTHSDSYGVALAIDGGLAAVGIPAHIVVTPGSEWTGRVQLRDTNTSGVLGHLDPVHPETELFGLSVAMGAGRIFVGDFAEVNGVNRRGVVEVFDAATYQHLQTIEPDPSLDVAWFGRKLAANDDYLIVTAPYTNEYASPLGGAVFVYDAATGQELYIVEPEGSEQLGWGVDLDGSTFVVGYTAGYGSWGGTRAYDAATGNEVQRFVSPHTGAAGVGEAVSISGGYVVAGHRTLNTSAGAIAIYELNPHLGSIYCTPVANSSNYPGHTRAIGSTTVTDNDFHLRVDQAPAGEFCMFINSPTQGLVMNPGGSDGNLCVVGLIGRHKAQIGQSLANGTYEIQVDLNSLPRPNGQPPIHAVQPGETWNFQAWHRDGPSSNFTDAISVTFD